MNKIVSIILAAGKGTRMGLVQTHKVCLPVQGVPVIVRAIENYYKCGIDSHFIVVGSKAEQVMEAASSIKTNLFFCYQTEQLGTGHAAKAAATLLLSMNYEDDILVVAGDKLIEQTILLKLIDTFYETKSDLVFLVGESAELPSSGRVIYANENTPLAIVEVFDIAKMELLHKLKTMTKNSSLPANEAEHIILNYLKNEKKASLALGGVWDSIKRGTPLTENLLAKIISSEDYYLHINGKQLSPENISNIRYANLSVYMFKAASLYHALNQLSTDNAQQEEYLTDTVAILAASNYKLNTVLVDNINQVLAFNTPEEFAAIQKYFDNVHQHHR